MSNNKTESLEIIDYFDIDKVEWDNFVNDSDDGWLYQTTSFLDYAVDRGYKSLSFAVKSIKNELLAVCPLYISEYENESFFLKSDFIKYFYKIIDRIIFKIIKKHIIKRDVIIHNWYSGPVLSNNLIKKGKNKILKYVFEHINKLCIYNNIDSLELRVIDISNANIKKNKTNYNFLWKYGFYEYITLPPRLFSYIDLTKSEEEIKKEMDEDCRHEIKKAEKLGIKIIQKNDVEEFHKIHYESWKRTGLTPQPIETFQRMFHYFGNNNKNIKIFFAEYENKKIAAVLLHLYKESVLYWSGCSLIEAYKYSANNYLLYSSILWAKSNGYNFFGVGLFESSFGFNEKEYNVGKYKAQFSSEYLTTIECKKYYSKKSLVNDFKIRSKILKVNKSRNYDENC